MQYIISDIHGCYDQYKQLLQKINFSDSDMLYILGDAVDRGPEPIKVLKDIMGRPNVEYILGNHDFMMLAALRKLVVEITEETCNQVTNDDLKSYYYWMQDGGEITARQFKKLSKDEQMDIIDFLEECLTYEIVPYKKKLYILVHAGIENFDEEKDLDEYEFWDFISGRTDYEKRYYQNENIYVVTGHTPTQLIRDDRKPLVFEGNGHIAIDCGCVFGGQLAAYCVETGKVEYVRNEEK